MNYCKCCKKRKSSATIAVESIATIANITPSHNKSEKLKELEIVLNDIISQLNAHYSFKVKSSEETLTNIYALILDIAKRYDFANQSNP